MLHRTSKYPRALKRGGRRRRTLPITNITNNTKRREKEAHAPHHKYYQQHIHPYSNNNTV